MKPNLIILAGATASGKTALAGELIKRYPLEIISADSRQVYRGLDIGTGKDKSIPQHMIDVVDAGQMFSVSQYNNMALPMLDQIRDRGNIPLVVGGTGYYIDALMFERSHNATPPNPQIRAQLEHFSNAELLEEIQKTDQRTVTTIDRQNRVRLLRALEVIHQTKKPLAPLHKVVRAGLKIGLYVLDIPRVELYQKIDLRVEQRLQAGMVQEVEGLFRSGVSADWLIGLGLEYRFITQYLRNRHSGERSDSRIDNDSGQGTSDVPSQNDNRVYNEMVQRLKFAIHAYARRQISYFRRWPNAQWLSADSINAQIAELTVMK